MVQWTALSILCRHILPLLIYDLGAGYYILGDIFKKICSFIIISLPLLFNDIHKLLDVTGPYVAAAGSFCLTHDASLSFTRHWLLSRWSVHLASPFLLMSSSFSCHKHRYVVGTSISSICFFFCSDVSFYFFMSLLILQVQLLKIHLPP